MATGGEFSVSLSKDSEELYEFCCTPCSKGGDIIEAVNQCVDCHEFYCGKCMEFHQKFGATSNHTVLPKAEMRETKSQQKPPLHPAPLQKPSRNCQSHGGERITTYCAEHGVVCCNTGVSISHKNCDGIAYIADAAKEIKIDQQRQSTKSGITATLVDMRGELRSRKSDIAIFDKDNTAAVQQVRDFTECQIKQLRELENATVKEINLRYKTLRTDAKSDVSRLSNTISTLETDIERLDDSYDNETQDFVDVKLGQSHDAEGRNLLQNIRKLRKPNIQFVLKTNIVNFFRELGTLGRIVDGNSLYKAKLRGKFNVNSIQDKTTCGIRGCCQLPDGTVMLTDHKNGHLIRLNKSYTVRDHLDMLGSWGIACISPDEVAITTDIQRKVVFVSVTGTLSTKRTFGTKEVCCGIYYTGGQLFLSCGGWQYGDFKEGPGHVAVYDLQGKHLRSVQVDPSGQQIFSRPLHVCAAYNLATKSECILVADWDVGVVTLKLDGTLVGSMSDPSLNVAWGVCSLDDDNFLVCGNISHNVLQFSCDGKKKKELLTNADGIENPSSLCFDHRNARLIVTMDKNDCIKVFDLSVEQEH